ncbi:hypothetical protein tb265_13320 [Gemmatimonadetes bacterium T265]|nr:hypothetical protein tb265_13320 [Gemmatimonadetes bacterium T265]
MRRGAARTVGRRRPGSSELGEAEEGGEMRTSTETRRCAVAGVWAAAVVAGCASGGAQLAGVRRTARAGDSVQVGYGAQDRRRTTGSVSSVSGDEARTQHMTRVEELLQRVPGVVVTPRGDGSYSVVIRGASTLSAYSRADPLFVIDGQPVADGVGVLNSIPPQDVERIDVLKDAEASIYGSRSANGVILIRTRHAKVVRD